MLVAVGTGPGKHQAVAVLTKPTWFRRFHVVGIVHNHLPTGESLNKKGVIGVTLRAIGEGTHTLSSGYPAPNSIANKHRIRAGHIASLVLAEKEVVRAVLTSPLAMKRNQPAAWATSVVSTVSSGSMRRISNPGRGVRAKNVAAWSSPIIFSALGSQ